MSRRIKLLVQKRISLRARIDHLANLLEEENIDHAELKLRNAHVKELFRLCEEGNDDLITIDAHGNHVVEFEAVQERYFNVTAKAERVLGTMARPAIGRNNVDGMERSESASSHNRKRVKLPEVKLPTFDGAYENWLSFKNAFQNVIDARTELTDDKLQYLKSALTGEAASKVKIFAVDGANYAKAWEVLTRAYEVKHLLIARHLSLLFNMPSLDRETTVGLTKLVDDAQQHVASLSALGVNVTPEIIVHLLESKMPKGTNTRWENTIERDQNPTPDQIYEFIYKSAVCASKRERTEVACKESAVNETLTKRKRTSTGNRAFLSSVSLKCVACNRGAHPLYKCDKFNRLTVPQRIELVKSAKLCYNCMRTHRAKACRFTGCTICHKRHNTLLHLERPIATKDSTTVSSNVESKPPA